MTGYPPNADSTRLVTDSVRFAEVRYEITDGHLIIWTKRDGTLAVKLKNIVPLLNEIKDVAAVWGGIRT